MTLIQLVALGAMVLPHPGTLDTHDSKLWSLQHVRGVNAHAREIIDRAIARSPTVARLVRELQDSDVIVNVVAGWLPGRAEGVAYVVATTPTVRYVRVVLRLPNADNCLMAVLGHELQHALEMARLPGVRDARTLAAAYARIGVALAKNTNFETDAAVNTGRQVAVEVRRNR